MNLLLGVVAKRRSSGGASTEIPGISVLHGDGTDAATTFNDDYNHAWTANGNAQIDTAQSKFGGASILFDGTGDYITTPNHTDFDICAGDFTVEFFMRINADSPSVGGVREGVLIAAGWPATGSIVSTWTVFLVGDGSTTGIGLGFQERDAGSTARSITVTFAFAKNQWYHIAATRSGTEIRLYVDGVYQTTGLSDAIGSTTVTLNTTNNIKVGGLEYSGFPEEFNGWIDELRISKGVCQYTANFTPPVAPLETDYYGTVQKTSNVTLATDNSQAVHADGAANGEARTVTSYNTGRRQIEVKFETMPATNAYFFGIKKAATGADLNLTNAFALRTTGQNFSGGTGGTTYSSFAAGDRGTMWVDFDDGKIWFGKNGTPFSGDPVAGTGEHQTFTPGSIPYNILIIFNNDSSSKTATLHTSYREMVDGLSQGYSPWGQPRASNLFVLTDIGSAITLSSGNRTATGSGGAGTSTAVRTATPQLATNASGYYFEGRVDALAAGENWGIGIVAVGHGTLNIFAGQTSDSYGYYNSNNKYNNSSAAAYGSGFNAGDTVGVLLKNGKLYFRVNGTWQNSADPIAETGAAYTGLTGSFYPLFAPYKTGTIGTINTGQGAFRDALPADARAWR